MRGRPTSTAHPDRKPSEYRTLHILRAITITRDWVSGGSAPPLSIAVGQSTECSCRSVRGEICRKRQGLCLQAAASHSGAGIPSEWMRSDERISSSKAAFSAAFSAGMHLRLCDAGFSSLAQADAESQIHRHSSRHPRPSLAVLHFIINLRPPGPPISLILHARPRPSRAASVGLSSRDSMPARVSFVSCCLSSQSLDKSRIALMPCDITSQFF